MPAEGSREEDEHSSVTRSGSANWKVQKKASATQILAHGRDSEEGEDDGVRATSLNAYSLKPTTVPPFALDAQFKRLKLKDSLGQSNDMVSINAQHFKDPFLVSYDAQWNEFVNTIDAEGGHGKRRKQVSLHSQPQSGFSNSSSSSSSSPIRTEKLRAILEQSGNRHSNSGILTDLESNWGGEERLNAIFEAPILHDYEFKDQKDRNEWTKYISQLKHFYYGSIFRGTNEAHQGQIDPSDDDEVGRLQAFVDRHKLEFRRKKQYWLQFEQRKKQQWGPSLKKLLLDSQYLPLSFRLIIVILTCVALGLAVRIFQNSHNRLSDRTTVDVQQQPSTIMAIVVNTTAIIYLVYIAYDEFSGKPLGLRNPLGKMRLILLDLLFIIFSSANLSLAFNTLYDKTWVCTNTDDPSSVPKIDYICRKQRALSAFLFLVVIMWVITFTISILRVVERVSSLSPR
ncbi:phospholipase D regulator Ecym_8047 [Eremothecium cymbalariae DBVPG|uniref:Casparian strip membrane protein domain-containing protein n=1 Tax=Eremothecium cymbalariae (strain CBS 270.75 / DBVPG 7215 / KCTC 17166 / NRRL Y-17582) TaxID=931890 RepID=G8JWW9_ERECY|nr:Hypothetical protein Ecym_8047 [Eremothecium cymbalariae DBVPG\